MPSYPWNPYMYGYQVPQSWFPQGLLQFPPNVPMMQPGSNSPQLFDSAENLAASTQINEEDVDQHLVSAAETSKGRRSKGSNFSPKEDVNLVKSWLEISCDPITSTGQKKKDGMWLRILQRYNLRRGAYPERSVKSLQNRWDTIKAEVGKFSSFHADVIHENPSGLSDADKVCELWTCFIPVYFSNLCMLL